MIDFENVPRPASRGINRGLAARVAEVLVEYRGRALRYDTIAKHANCRLDQVGPTISYLLGIGAKISRPLVRTVVFHRFAEEDARVTKTVPVKAAPSQIDKLTQYLLDHNGEQVTLNDLMDVALTSRQNTMVLLSRMRKERRWTITRNDDGSYTSTPPGQAPEPEPQEQDTTPEVEVDVDVVDIPPTVLPVTMPDPIPVLPTNSTSAFAVGDTVIFEVVGRLGHFDDTHLVRDPDGQMFRISPLT